MQNQKFQHKINCNIHTVTVISDTKPLVDVQGVALKRICGKENDKEKYSIHINPNNYIQDDINSLADFNRILEEIENTAGLTNCQLARADVKFDSYEENYDELLKLNKLVVLLCSITFHLDNRYQAIDPLTIDALTVRVQNDYYEVENYNKALESKYKDKAYNRLEVRSKALLKKTKKSIAEIIEDWLKKLEIVINEYERLQDICNTLLIKRWRLERNIKVKSFAEFIRKYQDNIYTRKQLILLYQDLEVKNPERSADKFKNRNEIEYISRNDLQAYYNILKKSATEFMTERGVF